MKKILLSASNIFVHKKLETHQANRTEFIKERNVTEKFESNKKQAKATAHNSWFKLTTKMKTKS